MRSISRLSDTRFSAFWHRLAWFVAIYAASVIGLGVIASILRLWLKVH